MTDPLRELLNQSKDDPAIEHALGSDLLGRIDRRSRELLVAVAAAHTTCSTIGAKARIVMGRDETNLPDDPAETMTALQEIATEVYTLRNYLDGVLGNQT